MAVARGTEAFIEAAKALNNAGDKEVRKQVYAGFRDAGRPLGQKVAESAGRELPQRNGLGARVARSKIGQQNATTGSNPRVAITLRSPYDLRRMDKGEIRHPVWARAGRRKVWAKQTQKVRAGAFSRPFEAGADQVRGAVVNLLEKTVDDIARGGSGSSRVEVNL